MQPASAPIVESLLDDDLYKFTMWQTFLHSFPRNQAVYRFVCRNQPQYPLAELARDVDEQLDYLCGLSFREDELDYLASKRYLKSDFIDFLRIFRFQKRYLRVERDGDRLVIVARGPQIHVTSFEIHVLSIVNELYCRRLARETRLDEARRRLHSKIALLEELGRDPVRAKAHPFEFFDFGTRRRFSRAWHGEVVATFADRVP